MISIGKGDECRQPVAGTGSRRCIEMHSDNPYDPLLPDELPVRSVLPQDEVLATSGPEAWLPEFKELV